MKMTSLVRQLALLLCLLVTQALHAEILQYENRPIEKLEIQAMNLGEAAKFDPLSVCVRMKTRQGGYFSQSDFDSDLKLLSKDYDRIDPELKVVDGKLYISLKVWPKATIRAITWSGNCNIDTKTLQKELNIASCAVFDRLAFNKAFQKLKAYYVKKGYFEAELNYIVIQDPCSNAVDIAITICEGRAGRIKEILFNGFSECEEEEILEMMATKTYSIFLSWFNDQGTYNEDAVQRDQYVILNYIQNLGYADAKVDIRVTEAPCSNRINLEVHLERGPLYTVSGVTFEGNTLFCNEEIQARLEIKPDEAYSPDDIRESLREIMELYGRKGYIDCVADYEAKLDCDSYSYSIHITIEEGDRYRVGLIKVIGNCTTQTKVILHETVLTPGDYFNIDKLQKTEERLRNIGYFKCVNVYAVKSDARTGLGDCYRDVVIEVEEQTTGNVGAGGGLSSVESLFGEFRITENNFNYRGLCNLFTDGFQGLRGGGEYVHLTVLFGAKSRKYALSWTKPHFSDTPWTVGFELDKSYTAYISDDYEISSEGLTVQGTYMNNPFLRTGVHYRLRHTHTTIDEKNPPAELVREAHVKGMISAVGVSLTYDSTNNASEPTCGFRSSLEEEFAGVGGSHTFLSTAYLNNYYIPVNDRDTIKFRADARFITPMWATEGDEIPIDERLFLGGENAIRGYRYYKLGPVFHGTDDPRGGMSLQLLSVEYARRYNRRFEAFVFADSGHLSFKLWKFGRMSTAVGFGVRVKVFEAGPPLMLGFGFPLNPQNRSQVKRFFFSIGGRF